MESQPNSTEDWLDFIVNLEETHRKKARDEGYEDGLVAGKEENIDVGLKQGFEVGEEIGFYKGCVDVWNSVIQVESTRFSARVHKNIKQMEELINKYPLLMNPENKDAQDIMDSLRLKFQVIRATLGVRLDYNGYPKPSDFEF